MKPVPPRDGPLTKPELRALLEQYRRKNWAGIQTRQWQEQIVDEILHDDGETVLKELAGVWDLPDRATVLDIGSGVGTFVMACRRRGLLAFGIEPDRIGQGSSLTCVQIAKRQTEDQVFVAALGEQLPFRDESFDLINMNQVMEHVSDQADLLFEAARVLKPGGAIYLASPNYLRFYEPHYKILWFPLLPRGLGRLYLRARGRDPVLLNQIRYTTNARLRRLVEELGPDYRLKDIHHDRFVEKCRQHSFLSTRARMVNSMMRWPLVGRWISLVALRYRGWTEGGCEMLIVRKG